MMLSVNQFLVVSTDMFCPRRMKERKRNYLGE